MISTFVFALLYSALQAPPRAPQPPSAPPQARFKTPYTSEEMRLKQAVIETTLGTIVLDLLPDAAPNHVGFFMKQARDGAYNGTVFHRVVLNAIIQGGDPISREPGRSAEYGSGGFHQLEPEASPARHTPGAVSAVRLENDAASGGFQFFISVTEQPGLDGQYTVFARVSDGLEVAQQISAVEANGAGLPNARVEIKTVTIRDTPPEPFVNDTVAQLGAYRAIFETTLGEIEMEFLAASAPETVRQVLRLIEAGIYDGVAFHRIAANFVIQTGSMAHRATPLTVRQRRYIRAINSEFNQAPNLPGFVSMARGDDPNSATTSFFICTGYCRSLDGAYTIVGRVTTASMSVVNRIASIPANPDETPRTPISITRARVIRP
jgi:cyclophilin family peptidyl-prolyl cis-trans isomerase